MRKRIHISLANKCQLLFGGAVILILAATLAVMWQPLQRMVADGPRKRAQDLADLWQNDHIQINSSVQPARDGVPPLRPNAHHSMSYIDVEFLEQVAKSDPFLAAAIERFRIRPDIEGHFDAAEDAEGQTYYRYARSIRKSNRAPNTTADAGVLTEMVPGSNALEGILLVQLRDPEAAAQQMQNRIYIVAAGIAGGLLAIGVFWFISTRIILTPVRLLRDYAAKVSEGNTNIRSDINTGDEFEELSDMFNTMLDSLKSNQDQLRSINKSLDLKLTKLAESNVALYEADKIKGEFLANVSHELRTPLNSIIGFAEVLQETLARRTGPIDEKRKRYAANIIGSSRRLLDLITDLLDLAKIEAGRMELNVGPVSITDTCEGLINLIKPQAEKDGVHVELKVQPGLSMVQTDAGRLQQIMFNFLSNAIKFTPDGGTVTLSARPYGPDDPRPDTPGPKPLNTEPEYLRISVSDTGPGIRPADHERIFEKFVQLDPSTTKAHGGTGLGLTISRQLAEILQGWIELHSDVGRGATFTLNIPIVLETKSIPLMPDLVETPLNQSVS